MTEINYKLLSVAESVFKSYFLVGRLLHTRDHVVREITDRCLLTLTKNRVLETGKRLHAYISCIGKYCQKWQD